MKSPKPETATDNGGFQLQFPVFAAADDACQRTAADFLQQRLAGGHRELLEQWFTQQRVLVAQQPINTEYALQTGQTVTLEIPDHTEETVNPHWQTIWQNDELLVVYKPPLLPVSRTTRNLYHTLISLVRRHSPWQDAHLLHRLDTETDGLLVLAKDHNANRKWQPRLAQLLVAKRYQARVYGIPAWQTKECTAELASHPNSPIRCQMHAVDPTGVPGLPAGKRCHSRFRRLASDDSYTLIECELLTGRRHQIRAHLAHLGHPIVGDKIYAHDGVFYLKRLQAELDDCDLQQLGGPHHQLTATELVLKPELEPDSAPIEIALPDALNTTRILFNHDGKPTVSGH